MPKKIIKSIMTITVLVIGNTFAQDSMTTSSSVRVDYRESEHQQPRSDGPHNQSHVTDNQIGHKKKTTGEKIESAVKCSLLGAAAGGACGTLMSVSFGLPAALIGAGVGSVAGGFSFFLYGLVDGSPEEIIGGLLGSRYVPTQEQLDHQQSQLQTRQRWAADCNREGRHLFQKNYI